MAMNLSEIQDLIKFVSKSGVSEVEIEQKDFKITIKAESAKNKRTNEQAQTHYIAQPMQQMPMQQMMAPAPTAPAASAPTEAKAPVIDNNKYVEIKSPMIGTFYRASGPDKPVFAQVGDEVKVGQTICIVEAMKLFNEIESEVAGKIVKVLVDDASPVEYDQPLFLVEPA